MIVNRLLILGGVEQRRRIDGVMLAQVIAEMTADGALQLAPRVTASAETLDGLGLGKTKAAAAPEAPAAETPASPADASAGSLTAVLGRIGAAVNARTEGKAEPAWTEALAQRDGQIAELQQAVVELANMVDAQAEADNAEANRASASLEDRIAVIESRMIEQDRTIRHTLTMLIEWIERDAHTRVAA